MLGPRKAQCPNCGGPIEFGLGSSSALVCPHCRFSVVRTDRELRSLGRVADLVPTAPPIAVGDSGMIGTRGYRVAGRMQLDHGKGPWDEWYIALDDVTATGVTATGVAATGVAETGVAETGVAATGGGWAWLARAQGKWFMTMPADAAGVPPVDRLAIGAVTTLAATADMQWTVAESGWSTLLSAEGELPFAVTPGAMSRYVDLAGPAGAFATIDYGDGTQAPALFGGRQLNPDELTFAATAWGARPEQAVAVGKVGCPSCGAPIELHNANSERAACSYCYALLDVEQGALQLVRQLERPLVQPIIALGTDGTLDGKACKVIGFMERFCISYGVKYSWREYLLYSDDGYRWLMEDNNHWQLLSPVSVGDVQRLGNRVVYDKQSYRLFQTATAIVASVVGEFYWKVEVGDSSKTGDYIKPPHIVSGDMSGTEMSFSAGHYLSPEEVFKGFGITTRPAKPRGVFLTQPNPHSVAPYALPAGVLLIAFIVLAVALEVGRTRQQLYSGVVALHPSVAANTLAPGQLPSEAAALAEQNAIYSEPFTVSKGPTVIGVQLTTYADNDYVGVSCALINEDTGEIREFYISTEYYHGVTGGESWTEGSRSATTYVDRVEAGRYTLRMEGEYNHWGGPLALQSVSTPPRAELQLVEGKTSICCPCFAFIFLLLPLPFFILSRVSFERRRWANASV